MLYPQGRVQGNGFCAPRFRAADNPAARRPKTTETESCPRGRTRVSVRPKATFAKQTIKGRDMELNWVECIGLAAGTLTTAAYLPQVCKTWRTKAVGDISLVMYTSMFLGVLLWLIYGILRGAPAVIAANALSLLLVGGMLRMKIKYGQRTPG
jgi:MtN3 and saliva related transmembrane protein